MKALQTLALAFVIVAMASIDAPQALAQGQEAIRLMTTSEIRQTASGNTTIGVFADRSISFAVYLAPNGDMIARISDENGDRIERGSWRVENNKLYGRWDNMRGSRWSGFEYRVVGENIHAYREDGTLDRIQYYIDGDALGLQAAAESSRDLVPSDDGNR